jgi:type VI secretion system secreted protein Hcp
MAFDMFLKIGLIKGEAKDGKYKGTEGWIDILAWTWGGSNSGSAHIAGGSGAGKSSFQDLSVTKYVDMASPDLLKSVAKGTHHGDATLIVRKAGDKPLEYIIIEMKDVLITSYSTGGSGGEDRLTENISLNFDFFKYKYTEQLPTGAAGKSPDFGWSIRSNAEKQA